MSLSTCVCEIVDKIATNSKSSSPITELSDTFLTQPFLQIVITNVMSEIESICVYNSPILLLYLNNIKSITENEESLRNLVKESFKRFIECRDAKLGMGKLKLLEVITYLIRENKFNFRGFIIREDNFLLSLVTICKKYSMNNILHN